MGNPQGKGTSSLLVIGPFCIKGGGDGSSVVHGTSRETLGVLYENMNK